MLVETGGESGSVKGDEEIWWRGLFLGSGRVLRTKKWEGFQTPKISIDAVMHLDNANLLTTFISSV